MPPFWCFTVSLSTKNGCKKWPTSFDADRDFSPVSPAKVEAVPPWMFPRGVMWNVWSHGFNSPLKMVPAGTMFLERWQSYKNCHDTAMGNLTIIRIDFFWFDFHDYCHYCICHAVMFFILVIFLKKTALWSFQKNQRHLFDRLKLAFANSFRVQMEINGGPKSARFAPRGRGR